MSKPAEKAYLKNIGEGGMLHAANKPFSDDNCGYYLMELGGIIQLLPPVPAKLLDLGCGTGWTSCFFAKRGYEVTGQDISADMISCANENKAKEKLSNLKFVESDYEHLDMRNEFDCAVFYDSLHHAENENEAVRYVYRALKPGGLLVVCEPGKGHSRNSASLEAVENYGVSEKDMHPAHVIAIGKEAGFKEFKVFPRLPQLYKAVYGRPQKSSVRKLFAYDFMRIAAVLFLMMFYKHRTGLVLLKKTEDR